MHIASYTHIQGERGEESIFKESIFWGGYGAALSFRKMLIQTSGHTCTGLGVSSPGCGALAGLDLGLLAAGCLDVSRRLLVCELLFVLI